MPVGQIPDGSIQRAPETLGMEPVEARGVLHQHIGEGKRSTGVGGNGERRAVDVVIEEADLDASQRDQAGCDAR